LTGKSVELVPDGAEWSLPVKPTPQVDLLARRAGGRKVVGLLGHLSEAKNIALFMEIAAQPEQKDLFFLIAGQYEPLSVSPAVRKLLSEAASGKWENVLVFARRPDTESDFNALVASSDALFAVYNDFLRSSNMLSKAAHSRRPVIVAEGYCMAERVRSYGLGACVDASDVVGTVKAMRRVLACPPPERNFARYVDDFSAARFQQGVERLVRDILARRAAR
jgi:glycosyltransferase involved in cell wall biosynthesis